MKFIKKHMSAFVALITFILVIIGLFLVKHIFFPNESHAIYGTRLEGREKLEISNKTKKDITEKIAAEATDIKVRVAGRIIYIEMKANEGTSLDAAKAIGNKTLECFSDEEKAYYDIQVLIENDSNANQVPIIGYKHHTKTALVWNRDRAGS